MNILEKLCMCYGAIGINLALNKKRMTPEVIGNRMATLVTIERMVIQNKDASYDMSGFYAQLGEFAQRAAACMETFDQYISSDPTLFEEFDMEKCIAALNKYNEESAHD